MAKRPRIRGLIGWFATNHVAANLLMLLILLGGVYSILTVKKESFPPFQFDQIEVRVAYPGAGPQEVEEGILIKIEEAISSLEGLRKVSSSAFEGMGSVSIEITEGYDLGDVTDEVKLAVDSISSFPVEAERPSISKRNFTRGALNVQLHGDLSERSLKLLIEDIRDEIVALPEVTQAEVWGSRPFEIAIELSELTLRQYGLTLDQVTQAIRRWSVDLPGGSIQSASGDIRLRAVGQAYTGEDFAQIALPGQPNGTVLRLGDVATITDGFAEVQSYAFFDGQSSFGISVKSTESESELKISDAVHRYVDERNETLPDEVELTVWGDGTYYLKGRLNMMLSNMAMGAVLVLIILGLFLHARIAAWVLLGLPVAFLGTFMLMPLVGVTINIMSLFAFILVLGIVVDDAIIIAESAFTETELNGYNVNNIVIGAQKVAVPATFGVLTTVMAFLPMLFVTGPMSSVNGAIGWVVVLCLLFSLVESKLILPSHLALMKVSHGPRPGVSDWVDKKLKAFIETKYKPFLGMAIEYRYATVAFFISLLILTGALIAGGFVRWVFFPEIDSDFVQASIELQEGMPEAMVRQVVDNMNTALLEVNAEIKADTGSDVDVVQHMFAYVSGGRTGRIMVELEKSENRPVTPKEVERRWREKVGNVAGTRELRFSAGNSLGGGPPIAFKLQGNNDKAVEEASTELVEHLKTYQGLFEIESSANSGPQEIKLSIKPQAEALGITLVDLASQVRESFYGAEAQRIQRGTDEIRVMVRYPRSERRSVGNLENMWIRLPDGREMPFEAVASYTMSTGYNVIHRTDGKRSISVTANADQAQLEPFKVTTEVVRDFIPELIVRHPGVSLELDGSSQEEQSSLVETAYAFIAALFGIYALMAIPLKSYLQPLIIMSVIPFGIIGAVIGHWVLGLTMNAVSLIGIIALAGVVVNDSIVMVDFVNRKVKEGVDAAVASVQAGAERFRAILLTSLTTFFGLVPILAETSMQAKMVVPMAVSLAFGILFSTAITLLLIPCLFNILGDFSRQHGADALLTTEREYP